MCDGVHYVVFPFAGTPFSFSLAILILLTFGHEVIIGSLRFSLLVLDNNMFLYVGFRYVCAFCWYLEIVIVIGGGSHLPGCALRMLCRFC